MGLFMRKTTIKTIGILGAGISGIGAARLLSQGGLRL